MNDKSNKPLFHFRLPRLRLAAGGILFVAAAALAATAVTRIKLPWAAPFVSVGNLPFAVALDPATNTIYVVKTSDNTIAVIDGSQCNASNTAHCSPVATMTNVGFGPSWPLFDPSSGTLYVANSLTESGDDGNTVAVLNVADCNAQDLSGCGQPPSALITVGSQAGGIPNPALDPALHTLYIGDANDGPLSMIDTSTCNGHQTSGCNQVIASGATGAFTEVDRSNHSVYVVGQITPTLKVFNGATCNAATQSDCSTVSVAQLPPNILAWVSPAIDSATHTVYLPTVGDPGLFADHFGYAAVIDGSTCNGIDHSGCDQIPRLVEIGSFCNFAFMDPATSTVYFSNIESSSLSMIDAAACNGQNPGSCPKRAPALATGVAPLGCAINSSTHTIYSVSTDTSTIWVLDASQCNAQHPEGCTRFARVTEVGGTPVGLNENPDTHSLYVANYGVNTVSIIDTAQCNQSNPSGCKQKWPSFKTAFIPRFFGINRSTNTVYLSLFGTDTIAVLDGATCNSSTISGCASSASTVVGSGPQQIAVDEESNTIYVVNQNGSTMSVIDGSHCNGTDNSGCGQSWPVAQVGASPQGLAFYPNDNTIYVTNADDGSVSVIDVTHCNAADSSGCAPVATFPVGRGARAAGVVSDTHTLFVANRDDLSVSVIDTSACNGNDTSGCPQVPPPAIVVGAFPHTGGFDINLLGRSVTIDQQTHAIFLPVPGDSDVVILDGNICTANNVNGCRPRVVPRRMGGFPVCSELDQASGTIYVTNNADATVSVFPSSE